MEHHQTPDGRALRLAGPNERAQRYTKSILDRMSPANRAFVHDFHTRSRNTGLKATSLYRYASSLQVLDRFVQGRPFQSLGEADFVAFVGHLRDTMTPSSVHGVVTCLRKAFRHLLDVEDLPRTVNKSLYVREPRRVAEGRLISDTEFHALLQIAKSEEGQHSTLPMVEKSQAVLWTLWDTGFRASELLALNVGSIRWDGHRGAQLVLPSSATDLKSGARTVYVSECVGPLRAWLDLHPQGQDPRAPLFTGWYDRTGWRGLAYQDLIRHLWMLGEKTGLHRNSERRKKLSPHDFRHTCATRKARGGWMEAELRAYFGWSTTSRMPGLYVHLALGDMRARVRRDAGIDDAGYAEASQAGNDGAALAALLRKLMTQGTPPQTRRPQDWQLQ